MLVLIMKDIANNALYTMQELRSQELHMFS